MKASKADLATALKRLDPAIRLVLLHGPDEAASRDLAAKFVGQLAPADDPMSRVDLPPSSLGSDPGRLADEAASVSMFGDRKLIRVDGVGEDALEAVTLLLDAPAAGNPVVMTAGSLRKGSKLLALAERHPLAFAFISYAAEGREAESVVLDIAAEHGLRPSRPAIRLLLDATAGDRGVLRRELEKLALYCDASPDEPKTLEPQQLAEIGADLGDADFAALVEAVAGGNPREADRQINRLVGQGIAGIALLRAVARRFWLLLELRLAVDAGASTQAVVDGARPPIFWKEKAAVTAQLQRWRAKALRNALDRLLDAERSIKQSGSAGDVVATQALLALSQRARG